MVGLAAPSRRWSTPVPQRESLGDTIRWGKFLGPQSKWVIIYGIFILLTQGAVLIAALWALLYDSPLIPGSLAISAEILGFSSLAVAAVLQSQVRIQRQRLEKRTDDAAELDKRRTGDAPKKLAEAIASALRQS